MSENPSSPETKTRPMVALALPGAVHPEPGRPTYERPACDQVTSRLTVSYGDPANKQSNDQPPRPEGTRQ
jgi:hypothetical protein